MMYVEKIYYSSKHGGYFLKMMFPDRTEKYYFTDTSVALDMLTKQQHTESRQSHEDGSFHIIYSFIPS